MRMSCPCHRWWIGSKKGTKKSGIFPGRYGHVVRPHTTCQYTTRRHDSSYSWTVCVCMRACLCVCSLFVCYGTDSLSLSHTHTLSLSLSAFAASRLFCMCTCSQLCGSLGTDENQSAEGKAECDHHCPTHYQARCRVHVPRLFNTTPLIYTHVCRRQRTPTLALSTILLPLKRNLKHPLHVPAAAAAAAEGHRHRRSRSLPLPCRIHSCKLLLPVSIQLCCAIQLLLPTCFRPNTVRVCVYVCRWLWGTIDRDVAVAKLKGRPEGTFLVRASQTAANTYVVSLTIAPLP